MDGPVRSRIEKNIRCKTLNIPQQCGSKIFGIYILRTVSICKGANSFFRYVSRSKKHLAHHGGVQ